MNCALNAVCPYFTMFPLEVHFGILSRHSKQGETVLDPFAGRGTTLYAGRLLGLHAFGIDSSAVAIAISAAKLANTTPGRVVAAAKRILDEIKEPRELPTGEFWQRAFSERALDCLCRLREGLVLNCESDTRKALRAIILGALHGPRAKRQQSYFSNQCPRTYAPKPRYAVKFWREQKLVPPEVDGLELITRRAQRYFGDETTQASGFAVTGDSQRHSSFEKLEREVSWIMTSPPYYGMRTYIPDQWLRKWFVGGSAQVDYSNEGQLSHTSPDDFAAGMRMVWKNCASKAAANCHLVIRFGAIHDRKIAPVKLLKASLEGTPWRAITLRRAGSASTGKRQSEHFVVSGSAIEEFDVWARLERLSA